MNAVSTSCAKGAATTEIRRRIFVVDNDQRTARRLASMLEEDGYVVEVFPDGRDAITRLALDPAPDAIVTDLVMPHASGIAVLGEARRRWQRVPVIFVTGHPELVGPRGSLPFASDMGPVVLTKPVSYADLGAHIRELLPPG
jgi:two-component system OmpR family response regulator